MTCWNILRGAPWPIRRKQHYRSLRISIIAGCVWGWFESAFQRSTGDSDTAILSRTLWEPRGQVTGTMKSPLSTTLPHQLPTGGRELWGEAHEDTGEAGSIADHFGHFPGCQVSPARLYFRGRLTAPSSLCLFFLSPSFHRELCFTMLFYTRPCTESRVVSIFQ